MEAGIAEAKGRSLAASAALAIEFASAGTEAVDGAAAVVVMRLDRAR